MHLWRTNSVTHLQVSRVDARDNAMINSAKANMDRLEISRQKLLEYKDVFVLFDVDGNGKIDIEEFKDVMRAVGYDVSEEEVLHMLEFVDADGSGEIDFDEFVQLMERNAGSNKNQKKMNGMNKSRDWQIAFDIFDADRDGILSAEDLASSLRSFGRQISRQEAQDMIDSVGRSTRGYLTLKDFIWKLEDVRTSIASQ